MDDMKDKQRYTYHFFVAAAILICSYVALYCVMDQSVFSHSDYDSYTRQAQSWWQGQTFLPENVTWLELAEFNGHYYVSFPPFPSVVQFVLFPFFGLNTPDNLVNTLFGFGAFVLIYRILMRRNMSGLNASLMALLMTLGSNVFYLSLTGWVWFAAQTQGFFFSALAVFLIDSRRKAAWAFAFLSVGLAFACRPFQIVYAPLLLFMLYKKLDTGQGIIRTLVRCVPYVLPLVLVGALAGVYNMVRFGSLIEFGHNYLPEFAYEPQFSLTYVPGNFVEILKLPGTEETFWPMFIGTLFFVVNPAFVLAAVCLIRERFDAKKLIYLLCLTVHFVLTLSHRTMGGWQFGSRYLVDMLPFMLLIVADDAAYQATPVAKAWVLPAVLAAVGIAVNVWGAVWFYSMV